MLVHAAPPGSRFLQVVSTPRRRQPVRPTARPLAAAPRAFNAACRAGGRDFTH